MLESIKEKIKGIRLNVTLGGILVILLGIMLVLDADFILKTMGWMIGLILALVGLTQFFGKLFSEENRSSGMLVGGLIAIIGIWIMVRPEMVAGFFPMLIGVVLIVHGVSGMMLAFEGRKAKMKKWWFILLGNLLDLIAGSICIVYSFAVGVVAMQVLGLLLIYDGVVSILGVSRVNYYEKQMVIDAEYWQVEDEPARQGTEVFEGSEVVDTETSDNGTIE